MSTRANVLMKSSEWHEEIWFYRHCDGYPDGALPTLCTFLKWLREDKIRDNAGQSSGWLILIGAKECNVYRDDNFKKQPKKTLTEPIYDWKCGSYEPTTGRHGDIEFLYTIDLDSKQILVEEIYGDKETWEVSDELVESMSNVFIGEVDEVEEEKEQGAEFRKLVFIGEKDV